MHRLHIGLVATAVMLLPATALGQFSVAWSTIDSGGALATSAGGVWTVSGTIGQFDASPPLLTGVSPGGSVVSAGFWSADLLCDCDTVSDGQVDTIDLVQFLSVWFAGEQQSDFNTNGVFDSEILDMLDYLSCWFSATAPGGACP